MLEKIALESEIAYIKKFKGNIRERTASLWAVKEAVFKAFDIHPGEISYKEVELCHKENGAPFVKLHGKALQKFKDRKIEISISHQKNVVGAVAVVE